MLMVFVMHHVCGLPKIEGIQINGPFRERDIRPYPATTALATCFVYVIAGSIGFERVSVLTIGLVRKGLFYYSRFRIFGVFFILLALTVRISWISNIPDTDRHA